MAPSGGPSMTSQARAAELNAAAAARARILNGNRNWELPDNPPRSIPSQSPSSQTNNPSSQKKNAELGAVESFRRPNRPVDRYYPPVATSATPIPVYAYPPPHYTDPRAMYVPAPYPVATDYYYPPMYQSMQSFQPIYSTHMSGYRPPSPLHRGAIVAMTRQNTSRSAGASPTKPGPLQHVKVPATPPVKSSRFSSPAKSLPRGSSRGQSRGSSRGTSRSPSKSPVKRLRATKSSEKSPVEVLSLFTPDDLSPLKVEVELKRFKAELARIASSKEEKKSSDNAEGKASPGKSPVKSSNSHEGDNDHHKDKDPKVEEDGQSTPRAKQPEPSNVVRAQRINDQLAMEVHPEARRKPPTLEDSPLTQKTYRNSMVDKVRPFSFLPAGLMPRPAVKDNLSTADQMLRVQEAHNANPDKSMYQDDGIFHVAQKTDDSIGEATPKAVPRRLQSPFQLRPRSPVAFYKPIVNKYARNVFASQQSRLEEFCKVETGLSWMAFRQKPEVKDLPGPFKGLPRFSLLGENAQRPMDTGILVPPPGFAIPGPLLLPRSVHWNPETNPSNRAATYYERVLAAEDWFHQSILERKESSNQFQRKLNEVRSIIFNDQDPFKDLPPPPTNLKGAQVTELVKRVSEQLISYTDTTENKRRGFDFSDVEFTLYAATGFRGSKRNRRRNRRSHRARYRGVEFDIAPGSEIFDGGIFASELC